MKVWTVNGNGTVSGKILAVQELPLPLLYR
jgi:hypothetical protein